MKIQTKYILFVVIVHLAALILSFFVFRDQKWVFLFSEVFILASVYLSWQIYNELLEPLKLLVQGAEAIADRDFNVKFVETGKYEMDKLINVYNAMIDELRIERTKQQEQHYFLEKLIQTSPTGIMVLDFDGRIEQVNPMALELTGLAEADVLHKQIELLDHPVIRKVHQMPSGSSGTVSLGATATFKVHKSHFMDRGFPRHFVMIETLTAEILEAEKNAYGKVIRMMAHEVNNTIGPVNSIMETAYQRAAGGGSADKLAEALQIAMDRNNNLNIFMRNFADLVRLPTPAKLPVDFALLVRNVGGLMETRAIEKNISFLYHFGSDPVMVAGDQQQLEQVMVNVVKNAMEAIEGEGSIDFFLDGRVLTVMDSGKGISTETSQQLFKPFFSTKRDGQGIGLTLIREVLYNHGFRFSLRTLEPGKTVFMIWF